MKIHLRNREAQSLLNAFKRNSANKQAGFTLVELLVALAISTVVAIAAISALVASRRGFSTVDAASQLRDNARFSADLIQRIGVQAGYKDITYAGSNRIDGVDPGNPEPSIAGFNNALASISGSIVTSSARPATQAGLGSDVLILRYQASSTFPGSGLSDNTMINCMGTAGGSANLPVNRDDRMMSVFYVAISQGEPSLMCATANPDASAQPIIRGVENFQVLYGVDSTGTDSVPDKYLRADQMIVAGNPIATNANWRKVRVLRIGMVLRGDTGTSQDRVSQTFYPLGMTKDSASGTPGFAMSTADSASSPDIGTRFTPAIDGRLRQVMTFTVHLRNEQIL